MEISWLNGDDKHILLQSDAIMLCPSMVLVVALCPSIHHKLEYDIS